MPPISVIETAPPYTEHHAKAGQTVTFTTEDGITVSITGLPKGRGGEFTASSRKNTIKATIPVGPETPIFLQQSPEISVIIFEITTS